MQVSTPNPPAAGTALPSPVMTLVVAMARNRVIGVDGGMPWHLPDDLKHFKQITLGKPIIMGRRTFESIGKALPGRRNIVISRRPGPDTADVEWAPSLAAAIRMCQSADEVMVVGGGMLYREALPLAHRLWLTEVDCEVAGDTWFPEWSADDWGLISIEEHPADERHAYPMRFMLLERINITYDRSPHSASFR